MEKIVKYYWGQLESFLTKEQNFFAGLYLCFTAYLKKKQKQEVLQEYNVEDVRSLKQLREIFKYVPGYELKRAVNDFEESINWELLQENKKCRTFLCDYACVLDRQITDLKDLEEVVAVLCELASGMDGFMVTPLCVNRLLAQLAGERQYHGIGEFCCGLSGMGIAVYEKVAVRCPETFLTGEDNRQIYCDISQIRMFCHGIERPQVFCNDVLTGKNGQDTFELVMADLPKGNNESISYLEMKEMGNEMAEVTGSVFSEWGYIYKLLERVSECGKAFIIATKGALVRQRENELRGRLIERDWLDAVITLPEGLYTGTYLGFELLIFDKKKPEKHKDKVFFADLTGKGVRNKRRYVIQEEDIFEIAEAYMQFEDWEKTAVIRTREEIKESEYSWNPYLHLRLQKIQNQWKQTVELSKVAEVVRGAQISKNEEEELTQNPTHYWLNIRNIGNGKITPDESVKLAPKSEKWEEKFGLREDDIVITSKGTELKICIVPPDFPPAFLCGNLTRIRADKTRIHPYVLYEFLSSEEGRISLESIQTGTTIRVLNNTNLMKMMVPIYEEGQMIGERLKEIYIQYQKELERATREFETDREEMLSILKTAEE